MMVSIYYGIIVSLIVLYDGVYNYLGLWGCSLGLAGQFDDLVETGHGLLKVFE
jgi:hypothetical protein